MLIRTDGESSKWVDNPLVKQEKIDVRIFRDVPTHGKHIVAIISKPGLYKEYLNIKIHLNCC